MRCAPMITLGALLCAGGAVAGEEPAGPWSGKANLGYAASTGNTETTSIALALTVAYEIERWRHELTGAAFGSNSTDADTGDSKTDAERYQLGVRSNYKLNDTDYVFGRVNYKKDRFSGYTEQLSETVGYGRRLLSLDKHIWNAEAGVGARQSDLADGTSQNEAILRLASDYTFKISDTSTFVQTLGIESGSDNTTVETVSELKAKIIGALAMALSFTVRHDTDAPFGSDDTDTFTVLSLDYEF